MGWGRVFPRLKSSLQTAITLLCQGWGAQPWQRTLDVTLGTLPSLSLSLRGAGCAAARHNPLGTSEAPLGALGITNYPSMAELSTAAPLQSS